MVCTVSLFIDQTYLHLDRPDVSIGYGILNGMFLSRQDSRRGKPEASIFFFFFMDALL